MSASNDGSERRVVLFAAASRAAVSLLALLTALIVTPYDTSTHLAAGGRSLLTAFANWDGVYFAHIAQRGYDYEHVHAFFPLYPMLMRALRFAQRWISPGYLLVRPCVRMIAHSCLWICLMRSSA